MKTLTNIITLALIASVTIACGAATQTQNQNATSASLAFISAEVSLTPAEGAVAEQQANVEVLSPLESPNMRIEREGITKPRIGSAAAKAFNCPTGLRVGLNGCGQQQFEQMKRPTMNHMGGMPNGYQMGGTGF